MEVLSVIEARAEFGSELMTMTSFRASVLATKGGTPFVGEVRMGRKKSGRGKHIGLECPKCRRACSSLFVVAAKLKCATCSKRLTRHQREHTRPMWSEHDGEEHDRVLRLVAGKNENNERGAASRVEID